MYGRGVMGEGVNMKFSMHDRVDSDFRLAWKQQETASMVKFIVANGARSQFETDFIASLQKQDILNKNFYISDPQFRVLCNMVGGRSYPFPILNSMVRVFGLDMRYIWLPWNFLDKFVSLGALKSDGLSKGTRFSVPFKRGARCESFVLIHQSLADKQVLLKSEDNHEVVVSQKEFQGGYFAEVWDEAEFFNIDHKCEWMVEALEKKENKDFMRGTIYSKDTYHA